MQSCALACSLSLRAFRFTLFVVSFVASGILPFAIATSARHAMAHDFKHVATHGSADIYVHTSTCNAYLIKQAERGLLINVGDGSCFEQLEGLGVTQLDWIVMTEHHREDAWGLMRIDRSMPLMRDTLIACSDVERRLFEEPLTFRRWYPTLGDEFSVYGASYVRPISREVKIDRSLEDGQLLDWQGLKLLCHATPGHSPGGMSFEIADIEPRLVFSGGLMTNGSKLVNWFDTEWDYGFGKGIDVLLESVDKLSARQPTLMLATQGPVIEQAETQLALYREKLLEFRRLYLRGYPVFDATQEQRDPISRSTQVPHLSQVSPHLFKLTDAKSGRNFAIIIADSGKGLVLDCGLFPEAMLDEMVLGMREHLGLTSIDAFWISHMHGDHFLLGPVLKEKYGAQSWTLDMIADRCENPRAYDYSALVSAYGDGFDGMKIDRKFGDGERFEWEGFELQMDWMPGQTEFGCCLWLEIDGLRVAFTGDNLFGTPSDPAQDGHEAVVARNSAILEEGYVYGSRYLKELAPDLVMGSHSFVMPDPEAFLERYHAWSLSMVRAYEELLPETEYEYLFDPYWVSAYPYRVDLSERDQQTVKITIRNFRDRPQTHRVELMLPPGVSANPAVLEGEVAPGSRETFEVTLHVDRQATLPGLRLIPLDIHLDQKHYGPWFDFLLRTTVDE